MTFAELREKRTERFLCRQCLMQTSNEEEAKQHIIDSGLHFIEDENGFLRFYPALSEDGHKVSADIREIKGKHD